MQAERTPIWFFIGLLLAFYGVLIFAVGLFEWSSGRYPLGVQLNQLHAPVWWGALLFLLGLFYLVRFRPRRNK
jgi:hypothetical protein